MDITDSEEEPSPGNQRIRRRHSSWMDGTRGSLAGEPVADKNNRLLHLSKQDGTAEQRTLSAMPWNMVSILEVGPGYDV